MSTAAWIIAIAVPIITGLVGFFLGAVKFFREEKQKAYKVFLPTIIRMRFRGGESKTDEREFNEALSLLLLYGSKKAIQKTFSAIAIMHKPSRGNIIKAFQEAIAVMREDVQIFPWLPWRRLRPEEITQFYSIVSDQSSPPD